MTQVNRYRTRNAVKKAFVSTANIVDSPREKKVGIPCVVYLVFELILASEAEPETDREWYDSQ
jgi:hypothetical protein